MSLGIKSFAAEDVGTKNCSGNARRFPGFTMGSWIRDGFLDSRWVPGFTMGSWIHDGFLDSRWVPGTRHGTARKCLARHGNILHGTDHKGKARKYLARHRSTRSRHGTARGPPWFWPNCNNFRTRFQSKMNLLSRPGD